MSTSATPKVTALYRYAVKGLSGEARDRVTLDVGGTMPFDRAYAIENGPGRFDPDNPRHLPKITFLMLMRDERLATLVTTFDDATETLTVMRAGKQVARGQLSTPLGRKMIEQFFAAYMKAELRGPPKVVFAPEHTFSDVSFKCVHIVNLASVRELERVTGRPVDPLRFRANVFIDGVEPWAELGWMGHELALGGVRLSVVDRTSRCDATNVDPQTGARDMGIPTLLHRTWGHSDFGVYAKIIAGGELAVGDAVAVPSV
ncbi:MAG: MOSC domain-containing protein [Hyphomicrobium sp.]|nr:MOSC domain-containing protein [Hyphomicrobium sp.]